MNNYSLVGDSPTVHYAVHGFFDCVGKLLFHNEQQLNEELNKVLVKLHKQTN